ncbi:MAG: TetR/AcrR family transcriptional regulator [Halioglobus sp.]
MARPPSFNRDLAVDAALKLFWRKGYAATSLSELLEVMGVARSSFYSTFSSKRELFIECLELFGNRTLEFLVNPEVSSGNLATIRAFFTKTVSEVPANRVSRGCMMVNTVLELADVDPALKTMAQTKLDDIQAEFQHLLANAQRAGELNKDHHPSQLAEALMTLNLGIRVQSRKQVDPVRLQQSIDTGLTLFKISA